MKIISMYYWIKNKKKLEAEMIEENDQYNQILIDNMNLKSKIRKLEKNLEAQIKLKKMYQERCKVLRKNKAMR